MVGGGGDHDQGREQVTSVLQFNVGGVGVFWPGLTQHATRPVHTLPVPPLSSYMLYGDHFMYNC